MELRIGEFAFRYNDVDVIFGLGVVAKKLSSVISGYVRALVIASRNTARISGALEDVRRALEKTGVDYVVFDEVAPSPDAEVADRAAEIAELEGVDLVIAIGGGSVIDVAKTVSLIANTGLSAVELAKGREPPRIRRLGLVVANLTHGTGVQL